MTTHTAPHTDSDHQMPEIPLYSDRLSNGLTLLVHENPEAENISVHIAYGVGAKDEPAGMFGIAHLLEHLMFSGSKNLTGSFIQHLQQAGAQGLNGTTTADITSFLQTVPPGSLDFVLFAESDRMGYLIEGLTPEALEVQRRVVLREMDENESQAYGKVQGVLLRHLYPAEHPYAHKVAGEVADLQSIAFDDAVNWIRQFYRPDNAVITLTGNITAEQAREKVTHWFDPIPAGEPLQRTLSEIPVLHYPRRVILQDQVDTTLLRLCWPLPGYTSPVNGAMEIFANILANLPSSLLTQQLMIENSLASDISAFVETGLLCSVFNLRIMLNPGVDVSEVEHLIQQALNQVVNTPLPSELVEQSRRQLLSETYSVLADPLAFAAEIGQHALKTQNQSALHEHVNQKLQLSAEEIVYTAKQWLGNGMLGLSVEPFTARTTLKPDAPVRIAPPVHLTPARPLPPAEIFKLKNGLEITLIKATETERAAFSLLLPGGAICDPSGLEGLALLTCSLLSAGTTQYDASALHQLFEDYQAHFEVDIQPDACIVHVFMPAQSLGDLLTLLGTMLNETQPEDTMIEAHQDYFQESISQRSLKEWALPALVYPHSHPARKPSFSQGTDLSIRAITPEQVRLFFANYYRPQGAKLLLSTTYARSEASRLLEQALGNWTGKPLPPPPVMPATSSSGSALVANNPGASMNSLALYFPMPVRGSETDAEVQIIHSLLAGSFGSRINYSLREVHQLTYNVVAEQEDLPDSRLIGFRFEIAPRDTLTAISIIMDELKALHSVKPLTDEEIKRLAHTEFHQLNHQVTGDYEGLLVREFLARKKLSPDYFANIRQQIMKCTVAGVYKVIERYMQPSQGRWLLSGDLTDIFNDLEPLINVPTDYLPADIDTLYK